MLPPVLALAAVASCRPPAWQETRSWGARDDGAALRRGCEPSSPTSSSDGSTTPSSSVWNDCAHDAIRGAHELLLLAIDGLGSMLTAPASRRTPPVAVAPLLLGGRGGWRERCSRCTTASRAPTAPALRGAKTGAAANELVGVADGGVINAGGARAPTWRATSSDRERPPGLALPASTTMSKTRPPTAVASTIAAAILSLSRRVDACLLGADDRPL